jgi:cellulose synthase/poly-beta-1,6-N-acetylglucosamine synthase-like glycosyltransferase
VTVIDHLIETGKAVVTGLAWAGIISVLCRNFVSLVQLATASWVFAIRLRPFERSVDLWSRSESLVPPVSVIAPSFNEELSIVESVSALLALQYPDHEVIVVNDGSTDQTLSRLLEAFQLVPLERSPVTVLHRTRVRGVYSSPSHPKLVVIDKENGRKADAVNAGLGYAQRPLVCVIDADSIIEPDGLLRAIEPFLWDDGRLIAGGGAIRVVNGSTVRGGHISRAGLSPRWLPRFQIVEYMRAFLVSRVASSRMSMLLLISGAFGVFRRSVLVEVGGYRHDTVGEDLEIIMRLHRHMRNKKADYKIGFVPEAVCWTEVPERLVGLRNQRSRWQQGAIETVVAHRDMLFNPKYGRIGMIALPLLILEDVIGPPLELIGYLSVLASLAVGTVSPTIALSFFSLTLAFGTGVSIGALVLEEKQLRRTPSARTLALISLAAIMENFGYRQLNLIYRLRGIHSYLRKETNWAAVPRSGFNSDVQAAIRIPGQAGLIDRRQNPDGEPTPGLPADDSTADGWRAAG